MSVHTIVYHSSPVVMGSAADYLSEIDRILATARRRNAKLWVTGALFFNEDWFVQVLEGGKQAVRETFERIAVDPRHKEVEILCENSAATRRYPQWSMAFVGDVEAIRKRFADFPLAEPGGKMHGKNVFDFMTGLANGARRTG